MPDKIPHAGLFGRYQVPESPDVSLLHMEALPLKEITHAIPIPVLDQEDLIAQGIDTSVLVPGAQRVDALGSCTANATTASLAERSAGKLPSFLSPTDAVANEKWAIVFYHNTTDLTGDPGQEWPPTDCGSSGIYCCTELKRLGLISTYESGTTGRQALSMLQKGSIIWGTPWLSDWMNPDSNGFLDGDGSQGALQQQMADGVAGGHELCLYAIEQLGMTNGVLDLSQTIIRGRNSWSANWGLGGDFLVHASTLESLASSIDFKLFVT